MRVLLFVILLLGLSLPASADQTDRRLDNLFGRLQVTSDDREAQMLQVLIWNIWTESDSDTVDLLMQKAMQEMTIGNHRDAMEHFNTIIALRPDFAEAWNKRATLLFYLGRYEASVADIEKTLDLEPRHFGALSGLGMIEVKRENDAAALKAFERALAVNPHLQMPRSEVERLRKKVHGAPT